MLASTSRNMKNPTNSGLEILKSHDASRCIISTSNFLLAVPGSCFMRNCDMELDLEGLPNRDETLCEHG